MTRWMRARRVPLGAEIALAFLLAVGFFTLVSVSIVVADATVLVALLGAAYIVAIIAMARFLGIVYAVAAAMAGLLATDWFSVPPTHPHEFPDAASLLDALVFVAVAVLVGEIASHAGRRAEISEAARSELADEQAALRCVATSGVSPEEVFAAVAGEVGVLLGVDGSRVVRYDRDDETTHLAGWDAPGFEPPPLGATKFKGTTVTSEVLRTGRVARRDDYSSVSLERPPVEFRAPRAAVGAPIVVDGRLWGLMLAWSMSKPLPETAEARLSDFTELIATAISNTASREEVARLADEQAALRRVATLVARGVTPAEVLRRSRVKSGSFSASTPRTSCAMSPTVRRPA